MLGYSYVEYSSKHKIDVMRKWLLYSSLLIDLGMVICASIGIYLALNIQVCNNSPFTFSYVISVAVVCFLRCLHIIMLLLFLLLLPCLMCSDGCCLKDMLVSKESASQKIIDTIQQDWTWQHGAAKMPFQTCLVCLQRFEQGQLLSFVPCQLHGLKPQRTISTTSARQSTHSSTSQNFCFDAQHVLHFECVKDWLQHDTLCPVCSKTIKTKTVSKDRLNCLAYSFDPSLVLIKRQLRLGFDSQMTA